MAILTAIAPILLVDTTIVPIEDGELLVTELVSVTTELRVVSAESVVTLINTGLIGPRGEKGDKGDQGDAGVSGDLNYTHEQASPAATWVVNHMLGKVPSVTVVDSSGEEVEGLTTVVDTNNLMIEFAGAFSGTAYLN